MNDPQTVNLSPDDVEVQGQQQPGNTPSLSLDDVEVEGQQSQPSQTPPPSQGPVNPYANSKPAPTLPQGTLSAPTTQPGFFERARTAVANSPIGRTLETYAPSVAHATGLEPTESETARQQDIQDSGKWAEWHPVEGLKAIKQGAKNIAYSGVMNTAPMAPGSPVAPAHVETKPNIDQAALGATQAMSGTMEATKPLMAVGIAAAPFRSAVMYGAGIMAGKGAAAVAKEMGATPNEQEFFHTLGFFMPDVAVKAAGIEAITERQGNTERVTGSAFGGRVSATVARNPEAVGVAGKIGGTRFAWAKARDKGVNFSDQGPTGLPPSPAETMDAENTQDNTKIAKAASETNSTVQAANGLPPEGQPKPKPGEPGSTELPKPAGMDDGALTQQTVDHVGTGIQQLPPPLKPVGILETVKNLAKWIRSKGTIVGPDYKVHQVTGQSPASQDQSAQTIATGIVNDEIDRQNEMAQQKADQEKERQETAKEEEQAAIEGTTAGSKPAKEEALKVEIPENHPAVIQARAVLKGAPKGSTAAELDRIVRGKVTLTTPVRNALVQQEIARRANEKEQTAENQMNGETPAHGLDRENLQSWADKVAAGEHPYVFVPGKSTFKPTGVDELTATKVKGSANPAFDGTYYHAEDIKPGDIRKAARDKQNPQAALDALTANWKNQHEPVELGEQDVEQEKPEETKPEKTEKPQGPYRVEPATEKDMAPGKSPEGVGILTDFNDVGWAIGPREEMERQAAERNKAEGHATEEEPESKPTKEKPAKAEKPEEKPADTPAGKTNLDGFSEALARNLLDQKRARPHNYLFEEKDIPTIARKLAEAARTAKTSIDTPAMKATLEELGIKPTYKDLKAFLNAEKSSTPTPEKNEQPAPKVAQEKKPEPELGQFKPGQKVLVKQPDGSEVERTIRFKHNNGRYVVKDEKKTIPAEQMRPVVAKEAEQEENTSHGQPEPNPASVDQTGGGRPSADSGSSDRQGMEPVSSEDVSRPSGEGNASEGNPSEGSGVRGGSASVSEQGTGSGSGPGSDTGLDNTPAEPIKAAAQAEAAKPKNLNTNWYSHPENWHAPTGTVAKLDANLAALRLVRDVEKNPRKLTDKELETLANYVGWGALQHAFKPDGAPYGERDRWERANRELRELLNPEELRQAQASVKNAHYTSPELVRFMWDTMKRFGFKAGTVLEPSVGIGNFLGMMPKGIRSKINAITNELDPMSHAIAKLLYPGGSHFNQDFADLILPDDSSDLAIGNPPFGDYQLYDPRYKHLSTRIHDFFFVKSLDKVRPGGILAFITSTGTMDKADPRIRQTLANKADFLGAIRLPSSAFKANAGTEVTTDLIFLQRRAPNEEPNHRADWLDTKIGMLPDEYNRSAEVRYNEYFHDHPEMMLGVPRAGNKLYGRKHITEDDKRLPFSLAPHDGKNIADLLSEAQKALPRGIVVEGGQKGAGNALATTELEFAPGHLKENQFTVDDKGNVRQVKNGVLTQPEAILDKAGKPQLSKIQRMKSLIGLRDAFNALHYAMLTEPDNEEGNAAVKVLRDKLNKTYDAFQQKYNYLNSSANNLFRDDPHYPRLLALENYDSAKRLGTKADTFTKRTVFPPQELKGLPDNPHDALQLVLAERGFPDVDLMARLRGQPVDEMVQQLRDEGLIFRNPQSGAFETRETYLSGYVRDKLREAELSVKQGHKEYEKNVEELQKVIPADIEIGPDPKKNVTVRFGATWVPENAIEDFIRDTLQTDAEVKYTGGFWTIKGVRGTPENTAQFGTADRWASELIQDALNQKQTVVTRTTKDGTYIDRDATLLAQKAQEALQEAFGRFSFQSEWKPQLQKLYNEAMNNLVDVNFDGSHLTFPGMNPAIKLQTHQVNAVWRGLQLGRALLAHAVGAGKTFEIAAIAMEARRTGTFRKPLVTVPNHVVEQWRKEWLLLYPGANLLVPSENEFDAKNRQRTMARIATGDFDAIILPHSQFNLMDISPERQSITIQGQMAELEETIRALKGDDGQQNKRTVKQLEKSKANLAAQLKKLSDLKADKVINFDDTGIDALFVDEAHMYKNLSFYTKMTRVAGLQQARAKSALRLKMKTEYLQERNAGKGVFFATGTPVQNTMAELYTMFKYVAPDVLERAGIRFFDDWAASFGRVITAMELSADGRTYKPRAKFSQFQNIPELMQMFRSFADVKTAADLNLPVPNLEGGGPTVVKVPASPWLDKYVESLMKRAEAVKTGRVDPTQDNMLKITTDGRKAATDPRLIDASLPDDADSKINVAVEHILKEWQDGKDATIGPLTQMVFLDLFRSVEGKQVALDSQGKKGTKGKERELINLYKDMARKLVERGVPREHIAFIHDYNGRTKRQELFDKMNRGETRILFGSTFKMGAGTNAQRLLRALHHIDLTWRPGDLEQRNGRILRQGNLNKDVRLYNYLTERSFDAYMAQTLETKARFIDQVISGKSKERVMADVAGELVLSLEQMKVAASGNPDVQKQYELAAKVNNLEAEARNFEAQKWNTRSQARQARWTVNETQKEINLYTKALAKIKEIQGNVDEASESRPVEFKMGKMTITDRKALGEYMRNNGDIQPGTYHFDLDGAHVEVKAEMRKQDVLNKETGKWEKEDYLNVEYSAREWGVGFAHPPTASWGSLLLSIEGKERSIAGWLETAKGNLPAQEERAAKLEALVDDDKWPGQKELDAVIKELQEVEVRLGLRNAATAPNDAEAVVAEVPEEDEKEAKEEEDESFDEDEDDELATANEGEIPEGNITAPDAADSGFALTHPPDDIGARQIIAGLPEDVQPYARETYAFFKDKGGWKRSGEERELPNKILDGSFKEITSLDDDGIDQLNDRLRHLASGIKPKSPLSGRNAILSEEGSATIPQPIQKTGEYLGKAAATTLKDAIKSVGMAGRTAKDVGHDLVALIYPRALMTEQMKDVLGKAIGTPALEEYKARQLTDALDKMFSKMPEEEWTDFIDRYENGEEQPTQDLKDAADLFRSMLERQNLEEEIAANLGRPRSQRITLPTKENYFPHRYAKRPGSEEDLSDEERLLMMANSRRPLEGSKAFLKQQKLGYREAIEAGGKPLGNPVRMILKRIQEGSKFVAFKYMMHTGKKAGLITYLKQGQPMPPDYDDVPDKAMQVWRPIEDEEGNRFRVKAGRWIWQKDFARGAKNYLSTDLVRSTKLGTALVKLKGLQTEMRLSWSGFHWLNIGMETVSSGLNLGLDKLYNSGIRDLDPEKAIEGLADIGKSIIAPITMVREGSRMMEYDKDPDGFLSTAKGQEFVEDYPMYPEMQGDLFHGGLRVNMADIYRESLGDGFEKDIKEGHLGKAVLKFFPWASHMLMKPLFEHVIPRVKLAFAVQMYAHKLNQYSEALANGEVTRVQLARQVASAVDYRFGEMSFDNLFWNNTLRSGTQFMFRSASWKSGSWLGLAKAGAEVKSGLEGTFRASGFNDHIYDKVEEEEERRWQGARRFTRRLPEMGINTGWLLGMGLTAAAISSVATWLLTKTPIWQHAEEDHKKNGMSFLGSLLFETMYPRTGRVDAHGEPIRFSFPTGLKDYVHAVHNPTGYVHGSLSDMAANAWDTMNNRKPGPYANYIYNPNDPAMRQLRDGLMYNLEGDFTPMSVSNWRQSYGAGDFTSRAERAMGVVGGAPKEYDRSAALNLALELRPAHAPETPEQEEAYRVAHANPGVADFHHAKRTGNRDYLESVFMQLSYPDAVKVFEVATPKEQDELKPLLYKKRVNMIRRQARR